MLSMSNCYNNTMGVEPIQQNPELMDQFDRLLMRAAKNKRKDIIDRYGHEGCEKLMAKGKQEEQKEDPELLKKNYESTIRNLLESFDADSPRVKVIESAWKWNLTKSPNPKRKRRIRVKVDGQSPRQSRRHSLNLNV